MADTIDSISNITASGTQENHGAGLVSSAAIIEVDLVEAIFAYILAEFPEMSARAAELKEAARKEFSGIETYIPRRSKTQRQLLVEDVMRLFNGRNPTEVARRLGVSRATVYRIIKTSGR